MDNRSYSTLVGIRLASRGFSQDFFVSETPLEDDVFSTSTFSSIRVQSAGSRKTTPIFRQQLNIVRRSSPQPKIDSSRVVSEPVVHKGIIAVPNWNTSVNRVPIAAPDILPEVAIALPWTQEQSSIGILDEIDPDRLSSKRAVTDRRGNSNNTAYSIAKLRKFGAFFTGTSGNPVNPTKKQLVTKLLSMPLVNKNNKNARLRQPRTPTRTPLPM